MTTHMKAIVVESLGKTAIKEIPLPTLAPGEILIKVHAVALNPADFKSIDYSAEAGQIPGFDLAGTVEKVQGDDGTSFKVGQRVAAFVKGFDKDVGAFAEYAKADANLVWPIPDSIDFEQAAAMAGSGPDTAMQHAYVFHQLSWPGETSKTDNEPFLVWSAATSVGLYLVQIAKLAGRTVIATASPKNFDLIKSLGADDVFDYHDADVSSKISSKYPQLANAVDCIATGDSTKQVSQSLGSSGGFVTSLGFVKPDDNAGRSDVKVDFGMAFTLFGKALSALGKEIPAMPEHYEAAKKWATILPGLIENGKFKSNPLSRQSGGLTGISDGLDMLRTNKVSAQKLTYKLL